MFNNQLLNSQFNFSFFPLIPERDPIEFDSYSLQNYNIITTRVNHDDLEGVERNAFNYFDEDGGGVLTRFYRGRTITLLGHIREDTGTLLNERLDEIKKKLRKVEGYLHMTINSESRKIKATCTSINYNRDHFHVSFCPFVITLETAEPFFYAEELDQMEFLDQTTNLAEEFMVNGTTGTLPRFVMTFKGATSVSEVEIITGGKTLTITTALTDTDVLIINSEEKTVSKNGVEIDYDGVFPKFDTLDNPFNINFTGTVDTDITIQSKRNYL